MSQAAWRRCRPSCSATDACLRGPHRGRRAWITAVAGHRDATPTSCSWRGRPSTQDLDRNRGRPGHGRVASAGPLRASDPRLPRPERLRVVLDDRLVASPGAAGSASRRVVLSPSASAGWEFHGGVLPGFAGRPLTVPRSAIRLLGSGFGRRPRLPRDRQALWPGPALPARMRRLRARSASGRVPKDLFGDQATAERVSRLASDVEVFHVAAHGRHSADNPLFSGVGTGRRPLVRLRHRPARCDYLDRVILSACESAARRSAGVRRRSG